MRDEKDAGYCTPAVEVSCRMRGRAWDVGADSARTALDPGNGELRRVLRSDFCRHQLLVVPCLSRNQSRDRQRETITGGQDMNKFSKK